MDRFVHREAVASCALDGQTVVVGAPSTLRDGPTIRWWHHPDRCRVLAEGRCSCDGPDDDTEWSAYAHQR